MIDLAQLINEDFQDMLGHELNVGTYIEFQSGGLRLYGEIETIEEGDHPKFIVKTMGWFGDSSYRNRVKEHYTINATSKQIYKVNLINKNAD